MEASTVLATVTLGAFLGAIGQGFRVVVGLKKEYDQARTNNAKLGDLFEMQQLVVSFVIAFAVGAIAGVIAAIQGLGSDITKQSIIALIGAGYAGTDFIEGFMRKQVPAIAVPAAPPAAGPLPPAGGAPVGH